LGCRLVRHSEASLKKLLGKVKVSDVIMFQVKKAETVSGRMLSLRSAMGAEARQHQYETAAW